MGTATNSTGQRPVDGIDNAAAAPDASASNARRQPFSPRIVSASRIIATL
jgi:hypothetical protein